jgi:predicted alpha/beta-fold hydrolase
MPKEWGLNIDKAMKARSFYEYHDAITRRMHNYATVDDYYRKAGSINKIIDVKRPLFCLSS